MLGEREILGYLLDRGLLAHEEVVRGGVRMEDVSRRNRNVRVRCASGRGYLVKQGVGAHGAATVAHEGAVYARLQARGPVPYLATCYGHDAERGVLILELLAHAQDFRQRHTYRRRFGPAMAGALGRALGRVHREHPAASWPNDAPGWSGAPPWILSVAHPPCQVLRDISEANLHLLRAIQRSADAPALLDALRDEWRADTLTHQDLKWDNCLLHSPAGAASPHVAIVDWESAGVGDPCWDAGSVISNYLSTWVFSIPSIGEGPPDQFLALARFPLERMHRAIRTFWRQYANTMALDTVTSAQWLDRATRYAAARLIQTGYEQLALVPYFTRASAFLLQLSVNILKRPREAVVHLLGDPLAPRATA